MMMNYLWPLDFSLSVFLSFFSCRHTWRCGQMSSQPHTLHRDEEMYSLRQTLQWGQRLRWWLWWRSSLSRWGPSTTCLLIRPGLGINQIITVLFIMEISASLIWNIKIAKFVCTIFICRNDFSFCSVCVIFMAPNLLQPYKAFQCFLWKEITFNLSLVFKANGFC